LLVILGIVVGRTLTTRSTGDERILSDLASQTFDALQATKVAYSLKEHTAEPAPKPKRPARSSPGKSVSPPTDAGASSTSRLEDAAIRKWRELANSHPDYASPWRKLGLTLHLFHRTGTLEALRHIASLPDHKPAPLQGASDDKTKRRRTPQDTEPET